MTIAEFQRLIEGIYYEKDRRRGLPGTFMWFVEEVGELGGALRAQGDRREAGKELETEFADCLAWLCTLASLTGVEMERAIAKYTAGCPVCHDTPCTCPEPKP